MSGVPLPYDHIGEAHRPRPRAGISSVELDDGTVVYDEGTGAVHVLNPTAGVIWSLLGDATLGQIADELSAAYGVDRAVVLADVIDAVRQLGRQSLLEDVTGEVPPPHGGTPDPGDLRQLTNPPDS